MRLIALDIATKTGWASSSDGNISSGVWNLSISGDESNGIRLKKLWNKLNTTHETQTIKYVVYEQPSNLRGHAQRILPALQGVVELWCVLNGILHRSFSPTEIKKHATGSGKANKNEMIMAAIKKWPDMEIVSPDQVDALFLLDLAQKVLGEQ